MNSTAEIKIPLVNVESERYQYFRSIWNEKKTDLENSLAMLDECSGFFKCLFNSGTTHVRDIRQVLEIYHIGKFSEMPKWCFSSSIGYLLFLISEKIHFNHINDDDDLAIIFSIIFEKTGINPYLFAGDKELFALYRKYIQRENPNHDMFFIILILSNYFLERSCLSCKELP